MPSNIPKTNLSVPSYNPSSPPPAPTLTHTEQRIWNLIYHGLTFPQIARTLAISINTVGFHRRKLYSKLNCHSKADIINLYHSTYHPSHHSDQLSAT